MVRTEWWWLFELGYTLTLLSRKVYSLGATPQVSPLAHVPAELCHNHWVNILLEAQVLFAAYCHCSIDLAGSHMQ